MKHKCTVYWNSAVDPVTDRLSGVGPAAAPNVCIYVYECPNCCSLVVVTVRLCSVETSVGLGTVSLGQYLIYL